MSKTNSEILRQARANAMSNKRTLTIEEFVENYLKLETDEEKNNFIKSIIYRDYCPILEKKVVCQTILNNSIVEGKNGIKFIDQFLNKVNIAHMIIIIYTKLDFAQKGNPNKTFFDDYDLLTKNNLMNYICKFIGEEELTELTSVHKMLIYNFEEEYKTTEAYIGKLLNDISNVVKTLSDKISEDFIDFLKNNIEK